MIIHASQKRRSFTSDAIPGHQKSMKCWDCNKYSTHKPWDNPERKKRCAKCYEEYCHQEAEAIHKRRNAEETKIEEAIVQSLQTLENETYDQMESKRASRIKNI